VLLGLLFAGDFEFAAGELGGVKSGVLIDLTTGEFGDFLAAGEFGDCKYGDFAAACGDC